MLRSALRFLPAAALLATAAGCALACGSYSRWILRSESAAAAAPYAAPFLLFATGAGGGVALGTAALCDAASRPARSRRSA